MAETRTLEGPAGAQQTCRIVTHMSESVDAIDNVSFVIGRCETSSRVTAYEKRLQHAVFLGVDLVRTIEAVITSQPFHRLRGREHAIGLTRRLEARGDVDGSSD